MSLCKFKNSVSSGVILLLRASDRKFVGADEKSLLNSRAPMKALFSVMLSNGLVLTATGRFPDHGVSAGEISCHPKLREWINVSSCTLAELESLMNRAALALGGALSVLYLAL